MFGLAWSPTDGTIAAVGARSVTLWSTEPKGGLARREAQVTPIKPGRSAASERASRGGGAVFMCCAYLRDGLLVAGTSHGELWCWSDTTLCALPRARRPCLRAGARAAGWLAALGREGRAAETVEPRCVALSRERHVDYARWHDQQALPHEPGAASASPLRMLDLRKLAVALADSAGRRACLARLACAIHCRTVS